LYQIRRFISGGRLGKPSNSCRNSAISSQSIKIYTHVKGVPFLNAGVEKFILQTKDEESPTIRRAGSKGGAGSATARGPTI
jgi:hypothetical protein